MNVGQHRGEERRVAFGLRSAARSLRASVALLTRVPVGGFPYSDAELAWSSAHLPLVGALLGALLSLVFQLTSRGGSFLAASLVVATSLLLTGALHEDGLADTADALGGGATRTRVFEILKDSRIGAFGAAALTSSLLVRVSALQALPDCAPLALVLAQSLSRVVPVFLLASLPYVSAAERSKSGPHTRVGAAQVSVAALWCIAILAVLFSRGLTFGEGAAAVLITALCGVFLGARFSARAGGVTGDFLGASQQVTECACLVLLALLRGRG